MEGKLSGLFQVAGGWCKMSPVPGPCMSAWHRASGQQPQALQRPGEATGCMGWGTHEKRWVASLGSGRPSRR